MSKSYIYKIQNKKNYKIYLGSSSTEYGHRKRQHWRDLRNQKHHSFKLQIDWGFFGEDNFFFHKLYECSPSEDQFETEQFYIDLYGPEYNVNLCCTKPPGAEGLPFKLINPEGEAVEGINLKEYCLKNSLPYSALCSVGTGQKKTAVGWTKTIEDHLYLKENKMFSPQFDPFLIQDPSGKVHKVVNQAEFCRKNNLIQNNITKVKTGKRKHHRGWCLPGNTIKNYDKKIKAMERNLDIKKVLLHFRYWDLPSEGKKILTNILLKDKSLSKPALHTLISRIKKEEGIA